MDEEDKHLPLRIKAGDESAFKNVFDIYYNRLCFFANNMIHDMDSSRSLVQQVFVDLWIKREKLDIETSVKNLLFQIVKNRSLDFLKHRKVESRFIERSKKNKEQPYLRDELEEAELNEKINAAIQNLPPKCREIFILCRFEELKYREIAGRLNISVKTVEMQIGIALKKIRQKLTEPQTINLTVFLLSKKS